MKIKSKIAKVTALVMLSTFTPGTLMAQDLEAGKETATRLCSGCHSIEKTGESAKPKAPPFREFASRWPLENLEEALAEGIIVGHKIMPEFELNTDQISDLLGYIATLSDEKTNQ